MPQVKMLPNGQVVIVNDDGTTMGQVVPVPGTAVTNAVVEVVRRGQQIIIPEKIPLTEAIEWCKRKMTEEEAMVDILHCIDAYPLDGAYAFQRAIDKLYGWSASDCVLVTMSVSHDKTVQVPWGKVKIPGIDGSLECGMWARANPPQFMIQGKVKAKHREAIHKLYEETRRIVEEDSVYRRKAIRIDFEYLREGRSFQPLSDEPKFMDLSKVDPSKLVFEATTGRIIRMNLFCLLEKTEAMRKHGVPLKRGILLAGRYGVGKSMTANVTAKIATDNKWTFIYLKDVRDLALAMRFAAQYAPAVLFAEDIDSVTAGEERTDEINEILNTIDGVDTKAAEIMTVFTTNHLNRINPAMLRPGRLDCIIPINPPDAAAVAKLVCNYAGDMLSPDCDLKQVGQALAGQIPATIRECVERSKANAIDRLGDDIIGKVMAEDIMAAAEAMRAQIEMITVPDLDKRPQHVQFGEALGKAVGHEIKDGFSRAMGLAPSNNGEEVELDPANF